MIREAIFLLACTLAVISAKNCYQCNSYSDTDHTACVDPMSPYPAVDYVTCPETYLCTRVSYITQKQLVVSRSCDPSGDTCNTIYRSLAAYYPDIASFNCYTCSQDYCNNVSRMRHFGELIAANKSALPAPVKEA